MEVNRDEKCDVTLPCMVALFLVDNKINDDAKGKEIGKKMICLY